MTNDDNHVANGICPSPTGEARWGLMTIGGVTCSFPWGRLLCFVKDFFRQSYQPPPSLPRRGGTDAIGF